MFCCHWTGLISNCETGYLSEFFVEVADMKKKVKQIKLLFMIATKLSQTTHVVSVTFILSVGTYSFNFDSKRKAV